MSAATQVQLRRGSSSQSVAFTGAQGEITADTDLNTVRVHDGMTPGGYVLVRCNPDGSIPLGQFKISADGTNITNGSGQANTMLKNGQIYMWDPAANSLDPTKPWRVLLCNNGEIDFSAPTGA